MLTDHPILPRPGGTALLDGVEHRAFPQATMVPLGTIDAEC